MFKDTDAVKIKYLLILILSLSNINYVFAKNKSINLETLKYCLKHGTDLKIKSKKNKTPFHYLALNKERCVSFDSFLLSIYW